METIIGLKEFRNNVGEVASKVKGGRTFIVVKRSKPLFKVAPYEEGSWETVVDFTKVRKEGVPAEEVLKLL